MANCLAPAYAQIHYTSNGHAHVMRVGVKNVDANVVNVYDKSNASVDADTQILAFVTLLAPLFAPADSFTGVEWFTQANCASAPVFKRNAAFGFPVAGSSIAGTEAWVQIVLTFKTTLGGRFKIMAMEPTYDEDQKFALAGGVDAGVDTLRDYLIGSTDIILAYDGGYPEIPLNFVSKVNDVLRKKYLNP